MADQQPLLQPRVGTGPLCTRCGEIASVLKRKVTLPSPLSEEPSGMQFGDDICARFSSAPANRCPLCCFIASALVADGVPLQRVGNIHLAVSKMRNGTVYGLSMSNRYLNYVPTGEYINQHPRNYHVSGVAWDLPCCPRPVPPVIDFSLPRRWLRACEENHPDCKSRRARQIPGLKVIACRTGTVVRAPSDNTRYVALSYVWGSQSADSKAPFARVVADAMAATLALGFDYLWVDKHCINQDDADEKAEQIAAMDHIYLKAEVTIMAAACADSCFGLPGVSHDAPRNPVPQVELGDGVVLMEGLPLPQLGLKETVWSSRGWTMQEAVISRRRLVFAEKQLYFECNSANVVEQFPPVGSEAMLPALYNEEYSTSVLAMADGDAEQRARIYQDFVVQYSRRNLTFDNDSFNAFMGISNYLTQVWSEGTGERPTFLWGVLAAVRGRQLSQLNPYYWFTRGLLWTHWGPPSSLRRVKDIPSWSCFGWRGRVRYMDMNRSDTFSVVVERISAQHDKTCEGVDISNLGMTSDSGRGLAYPSSISVTCPVYDGKEVVDVETQCGDKSFLLRGLPLTFQLSIGPDGYSDVHKFISEEARGLSGWKLLRFATATINQGRCESILLVVCRKEGGSYERVGVAYLEHRARSAVQEGYDDSTCLLSTVNESITIT